MSSASDERFLGLDFGTESVRALIVDATGGEVGSAVAPFKHGQITPESDAAHALFQQTLPHSFAIQHPADWLESAAQAVRESVRAIDPAQVQSIGVDFTSCTMLPCVADGRALCEARPDLARDPHAWPKLWKHHGAVDQTARLNTIARQRNEPWLINRYGGIIGLEWLLPKMLEVIDHAPRINDATDVWLEAGDWLVWQLIGTPAPGRPAPGTSGGATEADQLPRSTCQAGYKACWSAESGYPSDEYLRAVNATLADAVKHKLPGRHLAPGVQAGGLCSHIAERFGLRAGIPVSAAIIDAHAGVPGAGVARPGVLVMVLGTSGCHMIMDERDDDIAGVPGVAGVVRDGILPGYVGYETGQAAMGDAFDWARRLCGHDEFDTLDDMARSIPAGADGLVALDWLNGCRTPLMRGDVKAALHGLTLNHTPAHIYRATLEASAMGLRWVVDTLREGGVAVDEFIATGGLPHHNPLFIEIIASALGAPVVIHGCEHGPALGAAILGAIAADAFGSVDEAVESMAGPGSAQPKPRIVAPDASMRDAYDELYDRFRALAEWSQGTSLRAD